MEFLYALSPGFHVSSSFFFNDTATTEIYTLSLHDALPIYPVPSTTNQTPMRTPHQLLRSSFPTAIVLLLLFVLAAVPMALAQVPRIDSVIPSSGHIGTPIIISGANFGPTPPDNIVYFGAVRATVTSASANSL